MNHRWSFWLLMLCTLFAACSKDPYIPISSSFHNTYSGTGDLTGRDILKNGNGFTVFGFGNNTNGDVDFVLLSVDSMGGERARKFAGTAGTDQGWAFVPANDGGYVMAGWTDVNAPGVSNDVLIVKTDADGNQLWSRIYGGSYNDLATDIIPAGDGFVVAAIKGGAGDENSWILRLDANGDTLWTFTYGGNAPDGAMSVCSNNNGTYALTGYTNSSGNGSTDGYVMIINDNGVMLNYWPFGTTGYEEPHSIVKTESGWAIAGHAGTTDIHTHNVFLQFVDAHGAMGSFLLYGDHEHDGAEAMAVHQDQLYIAGRSSSRDPLQDPFFVKTDLAGNELEKKWLGSSQEDPGLGLYVDNFQVLMTGYSVNPSTGRKDLLLLRR